LLKRTTTMDYTTLGCLLPRYFRVVGDPSRDLSTAEVGNRVIRRVQWAPDFYAIPGCIPLHDSNDSVKSHIANGLYPMDIASAIAVMVLGLSANSRTSVLDLCCCPGSKLGLIAERLSPESIVVGVDISESRLHVCKSLLRTWSEPLARFQKKESARQLIFHGDGTSFCDTSTGKLVYDSSIIKEEISMFGGVKKRNKSYIKREQKRLNSLESKMCGEAAYEGNEHVVVERILPSSYDYVLVDAECTHDASYKHMQFIPANVEGGVESDAENEIKHSMKSIGRKRPHDKPQASLSHGTDTTENVSSEALRELQQSLLFNGFRNLKPGGVLVYSTCSQAREQNEYIVEWFLQTVKEEAELLSVLDTLRDVLSALSEMPDSSSESADQRDVFGTAEFRFALSSPHSTSSSICPLRLLQQDLPALMHTVQTQYPTEEMRRALSFAICDAVTAQARPVVLESELLPGTVRLSYKGGMSGHYIAKIRKVDRVIL